MYRIVVTRKIPGIEEASQALPPPWKVWVNPSEFELTRTELVEQASDADGMLVCGDRIDDSLMAAMPRMKVLSNYGVGLDNIDLEAAQRRGIIVRNLPDAVTYSTAELAVALMPACTRRITEADRLVRGSNPFARTPTIVIGRNLRGKTLGIVGFGRIGQKVVEMAKAFEMKIIYYSRSRKPEAERHLAAEYRSLEDLLKTADVVSLHVPGGDSTRHLLGPEQLMLMKREAILINVSRGTVVDEAALAEALCSGRVAAAGLDVYEYEPFVNERLAALPNVVLTPHIGCSTWDTRYAMTTKAVENIYEVLAGI
ncbi:MAG TPA: D-glycerate dehydrogenase [Limnochordia bacterium]|nr:D-glycerate dehydrogenase [Limnochordia bacterium]